MSTRRDFLKYSAAASASGLLPFSMKAPAAVKSGSSLSVAIVADPLTFDPHLAGNLQGRATTQAIHDTLLTVDKDGRLAPNLAQIRNPDTGSIRGGEIGTLDTVEVVDSHTIKLTLKNAFAAFLFPLIWAGGQARCSWEVSSSSPPIRQPAPRTERDRCHLPACGSGRCRSWSASASAYPSTRRMPSRS